MLAFAKNIYSRMMRANAVCWCRCAKTPTTGKKYNQLIIKFIIKQILILYLQNKKGSYFRIQQ
jgi:hypothetical protein